MPRWAATLITVLLGMALTAGLGWVAFTLRIGQPLARLSYDMMFLFRGTQRASPEIRLVDIDENSSDVLKQPRSGIWSRKTHAELVRRLTREGARAIFFDVIFDQASEEPGADEEFAAALKENGRVFLGGSLLSPTEGRAEQQIFIEQVKLPHVPLRRAARGSGVVAVELDPDKAVRRMHTGTEQIPSATWRVAKFLEADLPEEDEARLAPRWLNYYGPAGTMTHISYHSALAPDGVAPDYFRDKIVIIGGRNRLAKLRVSEDEFAVPWTRWGGFFMPGAEVHANTLLNLLDRSWLKRGDERTEGMFVIGLGVVIGGLLARLRPLVAVLAGTLLAVAILAKALWYFEYELIWYNWLVPVVVQTPIAIVWSFAANYSLEARRRAQIRRAFSLYLSPHMADRIADARFDLKPGGKLVEATVVFTDLKGFTPLAEKLGDPERVSDILVEYFTNTTQHVLGSNGTVIKYIGDAVFAAWGAPLADPQHAINAVRAAWQMHLSSEVEVQGHRLVTRVGINTGQMLAGNLGSRFRFDYTLIGDPVNFASRLEGLNKTLGTHVLLSEATRAQLGGQFTTREMGRFIVVGKTQHETIHELLGPADGPPPSWIATFVSALAAFQSRDFENARRLFQRAHEERENGDQPSRFYLEEIERLQTATLPGTWNGAIEITIK